MDLKYSSLSSLTSLKLIPMYFNISDCVEHNSPHLVLLIIQKYSDPQSKQLSLNI